jgi:GPH family glycoside/pentoside/hexuronide:cation symporter
MTSCVDQGIKMRGMTSPDGAKLPLSVVLGWASGSLAMGIIYYTTNGLLLRYLVDFMGVTAVAAGAMLGASKIVDAVIDPMIGIASDRTQSRWGRRRPYLFVGGILCSLSFMVAFAMPVISETVLRDTVILIVLIALAAGYGIFNIPYIAMPAEMDVSSSERTRLMSFRVAAIQGGTIVSIIFGPMLIDAFGGGRLGHQLMAVVVGLAILMMSMCCFWFTRDAPARPIEPQTEQRKFREQIRLAMENRPFFLLILIKLVTLFGGGLQAAVKPFLFLILLKSDYAMMGVSLMATAVTLIVSQPFWVSMSKRLGNKRLYMYAQPFNAVIVLSWLLAGPNESAILIVLRSCAIGFIGGAGMLSLQALLPETIEYDYLRTGMRREGVFSGIYTTIEKLASAFAASAVGLFLGAFGYVASTSGGIEQSADVIGAIQLSYVVSAVCVLLSAFMIRKYKLNLDDHRSPPAVTTAPDGSTV